MGKRYDKEFKIEAVLLASEPGNTQAQIERNLGLGQGVIGRWKRQLKKVTANTPSLARGVSSPRTKKIETLSAKSSDFDGSVTS